MGETIAFISIKGGVGKTTVALEIATALANVFDKKVLLVDANFSAPNLDLYLGLQPELTLHHALNGQAGQGLHNIIYEKHNLHIIPAAMVYKKKVDFLKLKKILSRVKNRYDYIILDSAPNYNELVPVVAAADRIFVVTTPDHQTLSTSLKAAAIAKQKKTPIEGIIVNKIRNPKYEMSLKEIEESAEIPVIAKIKDNKNMARALYLREPMTVNDDKDIISREIKKFASAICGLPEESNGFLRKILPFRSLMGREKVNRELMRQNYYSSQL